MKLSLFVNESSSILSLLTVMTITLPSVVSADAIVVRNELIACSLIDSPGLHTVAVIHAYSNGAVASRFKVEPAGGMTMTYVSETHAFTSVGTMRDGISMCYDNCYLGDVVVGTITYQGYGTSNSCAQLVVKPYPGAETLDVMTCGNQPKEARTYHFEVIGPQNPGCNLCIDHDDGTAYPGAPQVFGCLPLPTRSSTWGAIKAMYR